MSRFLFFSFFCSFSSAVCYMAHGSVSHRACRSMRNAELRLLKPNISSITWTQPYCCIQALSSAYPRWWNQVQRYTIFSRSNIPLKRINIAPSISKSYAKSCCMKTKKQLPERSCYIHRIRKLIAPIQPML